MIYSQQRDTLSGIKGYLGNVDMERGEQEKQHDGIQTFMNEDASYNTRFDELEFLMTMTTALFLIKEEKTQTNA